MSVRSIAKKLSRFGSPFSKCEMQIASAEALYQSIHLHGRVVEWSEPQMVLWFADHHGTEASKLVANGGLLYSLHGLWYASGHENTSPSVRYAPAAALDSGLLPLLTNDLYREYERHARVRFKNELEFFWCDQVMLPQTPGNGGRVEGLGL